MATFNVTKTRGALKALRQVQRIGRGGENRAFLMDVHPFTRSLRIFIACARAWEARVDNRFYEVGIAEGMAFMGNRCFRYYARTISDLLAFYVAFPISGWFIAPYLEQQSRPVIVAMGLFRAVLPFLSSYMGSAFGRKLTFAAYRAANYRWKPVQSILHFHETRGCYQDLEGDEKLLALARDISSVLGNDQNPIHNRTALLTLGFEIIGAGSGGHSYFRKSCDSHSLFTLHITPYGPSILNEMPRYIILARRFRPYNQLNMWDKSEAYFFDAAIPPRAEIQGFTYSGAYFTNQEWAALTNRYALELFSYNNACKIMGTPRSHIDSTKLQHNEIAFPPTDLITLKAFIRTGHKSKKRRKETKRWKQVQAAVQQIADAVQKYKSKGVAPNGVILYMDGLDCSGKSSTGGLICDALVKSGYTVSMVQYNKPPTEEEKERPWMDRFATPLDGTENNCNTYASIVWDRGPAGDFVYGSLNQLSLQDKLARYEDFRKFDLECDQRGILFCKLLFVTDRDSIAETLGKRLAHKQIAEDLQTWLDANSFPHFREGLEELRAHIDPTDFFAFNKFKENLANFCEFARNTDNVGHVGIQRFTSIGYSNPWHVVCTSKRHPARMALMKAFRSQLRDFAVAPQTRTKIVDSTGVFFGVDKEDEPVLRPAPKNIVEVREHGISIKACLISSLLGLLVYAYCYQTWNFNIQDIT
jgi:polyphosphate kinase 2 (PPK2 family)